jgi:hypothetical protein
MAGLIQPGSGGAVIRTGSPCLESPSGLESPAGIVFHGRPDSCQASAGTGDSSMTSSGIREGL